MRVGAQQASPGSIPRASRSGHASPAGASRCPPGPGALTGPPSPSCTRGDYARPQRSRPRWGACCSNGCDHQRRPTNSDYADVHGRETRSLGHLSWHAPHRARRRRSPMCRRSPLPPGSSPDGDAPGLDLPHTGTKSHAGGRPELAALLASRACELPPQQAGLGVLLRARASRSNGSATLRRGQRLTTTRAVTNNANLKPTRRRNARRLQATKCAAGISWDYLFQFDGGVPPWTSGLSQGTALQVLSRAWSRFKEPADLDCRPASARASSRRHRRREFGCPSQSSGRSLPRSTPTHQATASSTASSRR